MSRQIFLDTETTGLEPSKGHRLIEIGCLEMLNRKLTGKSFHSYINPEREVDPGAYAITGISSEFLLDKPKFHHIVDEFLAFIKNAEIIIHNAPFDVGFINHELKLLSHPWGSVDEYVQIFDTLALARRMHPGQKNNLDALCKRYNIDNSHRTHHGALLDAEILSRVYLQMTAGQGMLTLNNDNDAESIEPSKKISQRKFPRIRPQNVVLKVVKASEEELMQHEKFMKMLEKA